MVSVAMAVYNGERYIGESIESVLLQTLVAFEFVIVDDGSTDGTLAVARRYAERDDRIRLLTQENNGASKARNRAIGECRYDWVAILDSDDMMLPHRLERQLAAAEADRGVVAWGSYAHGISSRGRVLSLARPGATTREEFDEKRARGLPPSLLGPTIFLNRQVFLDVGGFDPRFDGNEDVDLVDRMGEVGLVLAVPEPLVLRRIHADNYSRRVFFAQRSQNHYVRARIRARQDGSALPTLEEFFAGGHKRHIRERVRTTAEDLALLHFRNAGYHFAERQFLRMVGCLALSCLFSPKLALVRVWQQKLSPMARQSVRARRRDRTM